MLRLPIAALAVIAAALLAGVDRAAEALPPAGSDLIAVVATADITSRLGNENLVFTGWAQIDRGAPHTEGNVEVVDVEIVSLSLQGASLIGAVQVNERPNQGSAFVSNGELRSLQAGPDFPASSFFDLFLEVSIPASPGDTLVLHNEEALHIAPREGSVEVPVTAVEVPVTAWPPLGVTYVLEPIHLIDNDGDTLIDEDTADEDGDGLIDEDRPGADPDTPGAGTECGFDVDCDGQEGEDPPADLCTPPAFCDADGDTLIDEDPSCIPLLNPGNTHMKAGFCVRNLTLEFAPQLPGFSVGRGGPSDRHPADILALVPGAVPSPPPGPVAVAGNDTFASAWPIFTLPFSGMQSTLGFTVEPFEETTVSCSPAGISKTAWYAFTPAASGPVTISTQGSSFDTVIVVYTGDSLPALTQVACNDDFPGLGVQSQLTFPATGGVTYRIQAATFGSGLAPGGDLDLLVTSGDAPSPVLAAAPFVRIACSGLGLTADGCDDGTDGDQDNLNALSFGGAGAGPKADGLEFSVAAGALGVAGSAVEAQVNCPPALPGTSPEPEPDLFSSGFGGTNSHLLDGNGPIGSCSFAFPLGLIEAASQRDDLDAVDSNDPIVVDADGDGVPEETVYFSLDAASPSLLTLGATAGDVLQTVDGGLPTVYVSAAELGLVGGDDLDGVCLRESGDGAYSAVDDLLLFSLAAGSPTLGAIAAGPGDLLGPGAPPIVIQSAATIGLMGGDDVNALSCGKLPTLDTDGDTIPNASDPDDDNDGCTDAAELGLNPALGGQRQPHNFWDFYEPTRDQAVSTLDFFAVLQRFAAVGDPTVDPLSPPPAAPAYHPRFDRGPRIGSHPWDLAPADGAIAVTDFFALLGQFGHACA